MLPAAVFLTGASVLVIEVVAVRVLSPYYGNTIFTVSSVISVILLALSAGYYAGGAVADREPSIPRFFGLILASGIALLIFQAAGSILLPRYGGLLSIQIGPLVSAAFLFLLPALLLGMLSPYAIKLQSACAPALGVGRVAGIIFFWSTLGSITGSLLAGFILIPRLGIDRILAADGIVLVLLGIVPLITLGGPLRRTAAAAVGAVLAIAAVVYANDVTHDAVLYRADGVYQRIVIYDGEEQGRPARFLLLDRSESGAMFLDTREPTDLAYDYTKYYALYKIFTRDVRRALVLGGGAYSIPKALLRELPAAHVDVAEIEPSLFELSKRYFNVVDDARLHNHVEDGRRFLQEAATAYDLIFGDVYYSYFSVPPHFTTREFFFLARARLAPDGVFIANMIGDLSRRQPSLIMAELKTFREVFPNSYFFAVESPEQTNVIQNITLVGSNSDRRIDIRSANVTKHQDPLIRLLQYKALDVDRRYELSAYPVLTDSYAPVEYLTARVLARSLASPLDVNGEEIGAVADQQRRFGAAGRAEARERIRAFLIAESQVIAQDVEAPHGAARNVMARLDVDDANHVVVAAHYAGPLASPEGTGVVLEAMRSLIASPNPSRAGVDALFLDERGGASFAERMEDVYGSQVPSTIVIADDPCGGGIQMLPTQTALHDIDTGVHRENTICTPARLEKAARALVDYLQHVR